MKNKDDTFLWRACEGSLWKPKPTYGSFHWALRLPSFSLRNNAILAVGLEKWFKIQTLSLQLVASRLVFGNCVVDCLTRLWTKLWGNRSRDVPRPSHNETETFNLTSTYYESCFFWSCPHNISPLKLSKFKPNWSSTMANVHKNIKKVPPENLPVQSIVSPIWRL